MFTPLTCCMKFKNFVAHCSLFCRFCSFTPTLASVSGEIHSQSLTNVCLCQFSYSLCMCVNTCLSLVVLLWIFPCLDAHVDKHTGLVWEPEQQLFIWRDPGSFHAVTPCYQTAWLSSRHHGPSSSEPEASALVYSGLMHVPVWGDDSLR